MEEKPGTFTDLFGYLSTPAAPETLAVEYIARESQAGRPLGEIFEDEYLTERFTPEQLEALLDRWDLAGILGEEVIERYRNPEPELEDGEEAEGDKDSEEDEDAEGDADLDADAEDESADDEVEADESPDSWAASWAGVEVPAAEAAADESEDDESEDSDADDGDSDTRAEKLPADS